MLGADMLWSCWLLNARLGWLITALKCAWLLFSLPRNVAGGALLFAKLSSHEAIVLCGDFVASCQRDASSRLQYIVIAV